MKVKVLSLRLQDLILAYGEAAVADSWKGSKPPEEREEIKRQLKLAYKELYKEILKEINDNKNL